MERALRLSKKGLFLSSLCLYTVGFWVVFSQFMILVFPRAFPLSICEKNKKYLPRIDPPHLATMDRIQGRQRARVFAKQIFSLGDLEMGQRQGVSQSTCRPAEGPRSLRRKKEKMETKSPEIP